MPINYKNYPANWLSEIRPRIMKRANDKCEICGLSHKQIVFAIKIYVNNKISIPLLVRLRDLSFSDSVLNTSRFQFHYWCD